MKFKSNISRKVLFYTIFTFIIISTFSITGEIICRFFLQDFLFDYKRLEHVGINYRYDKNLGWFPIKNSNKLVEDCRPFYIKHNERGFRDHEHKQTSKPKIILLGDSFVWGYNVAKEERISEKLQEIIPNWEIFNLGISGYGTDQEYILIKKHFDYYKPDIVVLIFHSNDTTDNRHNFRYEAYKPYFLLNNENIELHGIPIPKSMRLFISENKKKFIMQSHFVRTIISLYFKLTAETVVIVPDPTKYLLKEINQYLKNKGTRFIVGFTEGKDFHNISPFLKEHDINFINLENNYKIEGCGYHWDPIGHKLAAMMLFDFINENNLLKK